MKNVLKVFLLTAVTVFAVSCQQGGEGDYAYNNFESNHDETGQIKDPSDNISNDVSLNYRPENPENPLPAVTPDRTQQTGIVEEGDNGLDKFAGNGSYIDERHPEKLPYYDHINGVPRDIPNNLVGELYGGIQFIQSHNISPSGNSSNARPTLVPYRKALLTLTTDEFYKEISAEVKTAGNTYRVKMDPPRNIPITESESIGSTITFSNKSWSFSIPEKYVAPGMEISFKAIDSNDMELTGTLKKSMIEFTTPTEVAYFFIRLGMLTDPPAAGSNLYMLNEPARAMADYYQTTPFARVINATYEPRKLEVVITASGNIYDMNGVRSSQRWSPTFGDYYSGDMRQDVAKVQYSAGVNLANRGVSSSAINESTDNHQGNKDPLYMVVHHAQGKYKDNSLKLHGLSGGAGMFTLTASVDNEFSHELGHGYGLGHYVDGGWTTSGVVHGFDTGWGYDSYKNKIRGNVAWGATGADDNYNGMVVPLFQKKYKWNWDTMSGGWAGSHISKFTYLTARTTKYSQDYAKNRYTLSDEKDENGYYNYMYWDKSSNSYKQVKDSDPNYLTNRIPATERGVPVITILGGYNPDNATQAVLYPYFRANYGHVFGDLFLDTPPANQTYLKIEYHGGKAPKYVKLSENHFNGSKINKIHVNIAESSKPAKVTLWIKGVQSVPEHNVTTIAENLQPMNAPVIIGKDYGYESVILSDIAELEKGLQNMSVTAYGLTARQKEIIDDLKYNKAISRISGNAKLIAEDYLNNKQYATDLNLYLDKNFEKIDQGDMTAINGLKDVTGKAGYTQTQYTQIALKVNGNRCIELQKSGEIYEAVGVNCNENSSNQKWFMDSYARIRSVSNPELCITNDIETAGLEKCGFDPKFYWAEESATNDKTAYKNLSSNKCLDLSGSTGKLITWTCGTQENQKFTPKLVKADLPYKNSGVLVFDGYKCLKIRDNKTQTFIDCANGTNTDDDAVKWFIDKSGRIHSAKYPLFCLEAPSYVSSIVKCSDANAQKWVQYDNGGYHYYKNVSAGSCMGYDSNKDLITVWNCAKAQNIQHIKYLPLEDNQALSSYTGAMMEELDNILANK